MCFSFRQHYFDGPERDRKRHRRKSGRISLSSEPSYGEKGVRQFHAKDCSKILDIYKAGLLDLPTLNSEFEASADK